MERIAIYALTRQGLDIAAKLVPELDAEVEVFAPSRMAKDSVRGFDTLARAVADNFTRFDGHVFIAAAGIVVRTIAPLLKSKDVDPAVVVMDQVGRFAVSLIAGHLGGANELAGTCARATNGQAVITTATDSAGLPSLDMLAKQAGLVIGNLGRVKAVNGALLDGKVVQVFDPARCLDADDARFFRRVRRFEWTAGEPGVWVSWETGCPDPDALRLYPPVLMLGVGCRRDVPAADILAHIRNVLDAAGLAEQSVAGLGSIEAKRDEPGLLEAARELGVAPTFFDKETLDSVQAPNPSGAVMRNMGVGSVSEASALLLAGSRELLVEKTKTRTVTLAVARRRTC